MVDELPLVTCILLVRHRWRFVRQAIGYFQRQDYPAKELVIVDDGSHGPVDVPDDPGIRYLRLQSAHTPGEQRNIAVSAGRGVLIAHWDDDTWQAPTRLARQVDAMARTGADACGARDLCYFAPAMGVAWRRRGRGGSDLAETSLMYRRACWERSPFVPGDGRGASPALSQLDVRETCELSDPFLAIAYMPPGNPDGFNMQDPLWERQPIDEIARAIAADWDFYSEIRTGVAPVRTEPATRGSLTVGAHYLVADGYGSMAEYLVLGMDRVGVTVNPLSYSVVREGLSDRLLELMDAATPDPDAPFLHYSPVDSAVHHQGMARDFFIYSMWESDKLPHAWLPALHRARTVIVPTRWCADLFRNHGVRSPIAVVPDGVDPAIYHSTPPAERPGVTTLMVGVNTGRKHFREGIAAWKRAFESDPDARLLLKTHHHRGDYVPDDSRITVVHANEASRGIAHWYRQADVFLALGNEGFGLPLVEAMACGLAAIALDSEGQGDVCHDARGLVLPVPAGGREMHYVAPYGRCGTRAVPSIESIANHLRWVATHRDEAAAMGRAASRWALKYRNVWDKGPSVLDAIESQVPLQRASPRVIPVASTATWLASAS